LLATFCCSQTPYIVTVWPVIYSDYQQISPWMLPVRNKYTEAHVQAATSQIVSYVMKYTHRQREGCLTAWCYKWGFLAACHISQRHPAPSSPPLGKHLCSSLVASHNERLPSNSWLKEFHPTEQRNWMMIGLCELQDVETSHELATEEVVAVLVH